MAVMIPRNQYVNVIFGNGSEDDWGIPVKSSEVKRYRVRLDYNANAEWVRAGEKEIVYNATIYFLGSVPIKFTDFIEYTSGVEGTVQKNPKIITTITDFADKVVYTKVLV
ncbi:hypothetical protein ABEX38_29885 [Priestia megaterium]